MRTGVRTQALRRVPSGLVGLTCAALLVAPIAHAGIGAGIDADTPAEGTGRATRGSSIQLTETLPPPPTVALQPGDSIEIPTDSGAGRRIVYSKGTQRIWLIEEDGTLYNTHRVSGRMDQPNYGTYAVFSRSEYTCSNVHPNICMRWMVRFAHSRRGDNIGFHEIPRRDGVPLQTVEQLGQPLSGGCVRQATDDAILTWNWAYLGTVVVVVP